MRPTRKQDASTTGNEQRPRIVHASDTTLDPVVRTLLSRLDAEQARAFRRKMAELDAERQRRH